MSADTEATPSPQPPQPVEVLYCPLCTFPPEYCSFGSSASKCKSWLQDKHPDLAEEIYGSGSGAAGGADDVAATTGGKAGSKSKKSSAAGGTAATDADDASVAGVATKLEEGLTLKQQEDEEKEREKKERREERKREKEDKERRAAKIVLTKQSRTKKKAITTISGLHFFSPPLPALKVISKGLASRLATGCSVSKSASNPNVEEITIQGDVAEDVKEMILSRQKPFEKLAEGDVTESQVKVEEEKKKGAAKEGAAAAAAE
ncbi:unnamed protein product [Parajaminaea phylloscopi]